MAAIVNTVAARVILIGLAIHAVLLPLLFYGLLYIVAQTHMDVFVNDARKYTRFLADVFELDGSVDNEKRVLQLLDSAVLGSGGVYAALVDGDTQLRSSLSTSVPPDAFEDDFSFGQHGDPVYFLSIPLNIPGREVVLRMGFDEQPAVDEITRARQRLIAVLLVYLVVSIIALVLLSTRMTRPLRTLQRASRNIAKGQHSDQLQVDSSLSEIRDLARDLESMRRELVGMNASLLQEIAEKQAADQQRALLESKLRQVQKLETVGVLAGGIAHEFNNILVPIFLYTEQAMQDLPAQSPVRAHLERVLKSSHRAKLLVQQILTSSRQAQEITYEPLKLTPIVEEALELLRALIPSTVTFDQQLAADDCMVRGDRNQLHQVVMNLCSNAYQAIEDNGGTITVTLDRYCTDRPHSPQLPAGRYVRLSVHDTGHGIERSNLDRIFEPFYTTRAVGKGTGLGLSVVHGIVVSHSGDITVESKPGEGATFRVYLPQLEQNGEADHSDSQQPSDPP